MYVTVPTSRNLVEYLGTQVAAGKIPKVYFALFDSKYQVKVLEEAVSIVDLKISGCILEESLVKVRDKRMHETIRRVAKASGYPVISLNDLQKENDVVIVVQNNVNYFHLMQNYFEKHSVTAALLHYKDIKNSAVVNGKVRVINRIAYLNEWPWFMDILNKDMPLEMRKEFNSNAIAGEVISNGSYYYYENIQSQYSTFQDGFRSVSGEEEFAETPPERTITMLGDSRFANVFAHTDITMASYFQKYFMEHHLRYKVKNFSVKANCMQNEFAMLKSLTIGKEDIIIATVSTVGQYKDFREKSIETLLRIKTHIMQEMTEYCHSFGAKILFVQLPSIQDIPNLTPLEQFIADSYGMQYAPSGKLERTKQLCMAQNISLIDLTDVLIHTERTSLFIDYSHFSPEGSKCIANALGDYVRSYIETETLLNSEKICTLTEQAYAAHKHYVTESRFKGITEYVRKLQQIAKWKPQNCGAIVMNCNPFTLGHRYLIEQAASRVNYLYILVVEEDRSVFQFKDRIEMIRRGVAGMPNVEVIPSGKFVISSLTFPEYFEKSKIQEKTVDTTTDIEIFCEYIAPALHIQTRFVGEEPLDKVTNQYNMCMKEILPKYGLQIVEIPRKESGEAPISASRVRKLLEEKRYEEVRNLVPHTTYSYLIDVLGY